jgi:hypothetical protein
MHPAASQALFDEEVARLTPELCQRRGWALTSSDWPVIDCSFTAPGRTTLCVRLHCDDWNDQPPSVDLLNADGSILTRNMANPTNVFNPSAHPTSGRQFVCMAGAREYHTHPSHVTDFWAGYKDRPSHNLGGILTQLWHAWRKGND